MARTLVACFCVLLVISAVAADDVVELFIAPNTSPNATCTADDPCPSLSAATGVLVSSMKLVAYLAEGAYEENLMVFLTIGQEIEIIGCGAPADDEQRRMNEEGLADPVTLEQFCARTRPVNSTVMSGSEANGTSVDWSPKVIVSCADSGPLFEGASSDSFVLRNIEFEHCHNIDKNNTILRGFRELGGVASFVQIVSFAVDRCVFRGNMARSGGALFFSSVKSLSITNSRFVANAVRALSSLYGVRLGGALTVMGRSSYVVVNSEFVGNSAMMGGAISAAFQNVRGEIRNCTFQRNVARSNNPCPECGGGAIHMHTTTISNCTFHNNYAPMGVDLLISRGAAVNITGSWIEVTQYHKGLAGIPGASIRVGPFANLSISHSAILKAPEATRSYTSTKGAGIYVSSEGRVDAHEVLFYEVTSLTMGGAVYCAGRACHFYDCAFIRCNSQFGGAIAIESRELSFLDDCKFFNNTAYVLGGAVITTTEVSAARSHFEANYARSGGAVHSSSSLFQVHDSCFYNNVASVGAAFTGRAFARNITVASHRSIAGAVASFTTDSAISGTTVISESFFTDNVAILCSCIVSNQAAINSDHTRYVGNTAIELGGVACAQDFRTERDEMSSNAAGAGGALAIIPASEQSLRIYGSSFLQNDAARGGAIVIREFSGEGSTHVTMEGGEFRFNTALFGYGGALAIRRSPKLLQLAGVVFEENYARTGGGLFVGYGNATDWSESDVLLITNTTFRHNKALENGGAAALEEVVLNPALPKIFFSGCVFQSNTAVNGSSIYSNGVTADIRHSTFISNKASYGGAVGYFTTSEESDLLLGKFMNCTFRANDAASMPGVLETALIGEWGIGDTANCTVPVEGDCDANLPSSEMCATLNACLDHACVDFEDCVVPRSQKVANAVFLHANATEIVAGERLSLLIGAMDFCNQPVIVPRLDTDLYLVGDCGMGHRRVLVEDFVETGLYELNMTARTAGKCTAVLELLGERDAVLDEVSCHVIAGPPSAISSIANIPVPPVMYCRASTLKVFVVLRDEFRNAVEFFNASWIDVSAVYNGHMLQGLVYDASEDVSISTHVVGLIPLLGQGNYSVSVTVKGAAVSVNPPVPFVWEVELDQDHVEVIAPEDGVVGESLYVSTRMYVLLQGNLEQLHRCEYKECVQLGIGVLGNGVDESVLLLPDSCSDGVMTFGFLPTLAGEYKLQPFLGSDFLGEPSTMILHPGDVEAKNSFAFGPLLEGGVASTNYPVYVVGVDEFGNSIDCRRENVTKPTVVVSAGDDVVQLIVECIEMEDDSAARPASVPKHAFVARYFVNEPVTVTVVVQWNHVEIGTNGHVLAEFETPSEEDETPSSSGGMSPLVIIGAIITVLVAGCLGLALGVFAFYYYQRKNDPYELLSMDFPEIDDRVPTLEDVLQDPDIPTIPWSELHVQRIIGRGASASVSAAKWTAPVGEAGSEGEKEVRTVALKQLHDAISLTHMTEAEMKQLLMEIKLLAALDHPNVPAFYGISFPQENVLVLVSELVQRGSLRDVLSKYGKNLPYLLRLRMARDISKGLAYLQSRGVIHRDVKPANILVDRDWRCKISDFGIATILATVTKAQTIIGTPMYMAPEVLKGERYTGKADVFSFAIMCAELFTTMPPYHERHVENQHALVHMVTYQGWRPDISSLHQLLQQLLEECWSDNVSLRPGFGEILIRLHRLRKVEPPKVSAEQLNGSETSASELSSLDAVSEDQRTGLRTALEVVDEELEDDGLERFMVVLDDEDFVVGSLQ